MKYDRLNEIEAYIIKNKSATNEELCKQFNISMQTLRRDLQVLENKRVISKVYGGVFFCNEEVNATILPSLSDRTYKNVQEKTRIGQLAANIVCDNDVIFVDSGTTACNLIPYLQHTKNVTVISHSLHVMNALNGMNNIKGICLGGTLRRETNTFYSDTSKYLYYYSKAFISTVGISSTKGLTNTDIHEGVIKSHVIEHSSAIYILCDDSKFDVIAFNHFADLNNNFVVITNKMPNDKYLSYFKNLGIKVIY